MKKYWEYESMEEVRTERKKVLDKQVHTWDKNCVNCEKIPAAIASGVLDKSSTTWKDRKNPVCDVCPANNIIRDCGTKLDSLILAERGFRMSKGKD